MEPVALLCGHAAPITDLGICLPIKASENGKWTISSNVLQYPSSIDHGALLSACSDGVLCAWSRASGHCRRRRKLPPWVGRPVMIRPLGDNTRYVCITCCFVNQDNQLLHYLEGQESSMQNPNLSKCTVIIVDSLTLAIVQTVFHGNMPIGPLMSMAVISASEDIEKKSVVVVDSFGKVLYLPIVKDPDPKGQNIPVVPKDFSISEVMEWADDPKEKGSLVAFAKCGNLLALVHKAYCTFRQAENGTLFGKISFLNDQLCFDDQLYVIGGIFLGDDTASSHENCSKEFVAWNNRGTAVIYRISYSSSVFKFDHLSIIPAALHPSDMRLSFSFIPLNQYLLRVESICFRVKEHEFWRPHVTIWHLPQQNDNYGKLHLECEMFGEGNFCSDWVIDSSLSQTDGLNHVVNKGKTDEITTLENNPPSLDYPDGKYSSNNRFATYGGGQLVSSSMVISENYLAPYAIVYGFFNGDIEIVKFHMFFTALDSVIGSQPQVADSSGQKHYLSGHTGAVLCLASHKMVSRSGGCSLNHVLLSGSMDCTVRVWDLDSGSPINVLHQHVAPVRQIVLPPCQSEYPWSDCFLTVGDDACVALISLQTLRVERLFPGHLYFPAKVLWDGIRNYIACLCPNHSGKADALDILYIWDVKTGARERVLRGAAAHSMFDHFLKTINEGLLSGNLINGNTSASSLVFPVIEPTKPNISGKGIPPQQTSSKINQKTPESSKEKGTGTKSSGLTSVFFQSDKHLIKSSCPFPGVSTLCFDLTSLMSLCSANELFKGSSHTEEKVKGAESSTRKDDTCQRENAPLKQLGAEMLSADNVNEKSSSVSDGSFVVSLEHHEWIRSLEGCLLQFSLSFLHLWNVDNELDNLLENEMKLKRPDSFIVSSGILGDRGSMTLTFPGPNSTLEVLQLAD